MSSKELENLNSRINQKEKDIDESAEQIKKLNQAISTLTARITETKDEKFRKELQDERNSLQKQADGLREDRRSLETHLSNLKQGNLESNSLFLESKKREREEEEIMERIKKKTSWKQNLKSILENMTPTLNTIEEEKDIPEIGTFFEFMNRDELLKRLYRHLEHRYTNFHIKFIQGTNKLAFTFPCCFSASGMGKTTLWSKGIEKMIRMMNQEKTEFYNALKKCYESRHIFTLDFYNLRPPKPNEDYEKYLCMCIVRSLVPKIEDFEFPDTITLLDLLKFMKDITGNSFFVIQFDETQELFPPENSQEWRSTPLNHLVKIIKSTILSQDGIKIVLCFTGLNSTRMSEFQPVSGATCENYDLNLLTVKDMETITNQITEKFKIEAKRQDNAVYRQFLSVLLGNPRLFSNFLSTCSQFDIETTQLSQEVQFVGVNKPKSLSLHSNIPFSIKGFANFVSKNYLNDKQVMWTCMKMLYEKLKLLNYGVIFKNLERIQNRECFLSLFDMMLNQNLKIERGTLLPHSNYSFGDLEKNGYVYLEPIQNRFQIKVPLIVLYHMSILLKEKNLPHFPIFELDFKLSWEDNEISDLQLMLVKVWGWGYQQDVFMIESMPELPLLPLQNLKIHLSDTQIKDFSSFANLPSFAFLNGKGSPWADSGIKLKILNSAKNTFEDYVYILLQSKRKESSKSRENLKVEWKKVYTKELDDFMKRQVLFYLISDGDEIMDEDGLCEEYNIECIPKGEYAEVFSDLFATLKSLKSDVTEGHDVCNCVPMCKCKNCTCKKNGLCGKSCVVCKKK